MNYIYFGDKYQTVINAHMGELINFNRTIQESEESLNAKTICQKMLNRVKAGTPQGGVSPEVSPELLEAIRQHLIQQDEPTNLTLIRKIDKALK